MPKLFNLASGKKKHTQIKVVGLPIPLNGDMAIIEYKHLTTQPDIMEKNEAQIPVCLIEQATFKFLSEKEMENYLKEYENA